MDIPVQSDQHDSCPLSVAQASSPLATLPPSLADVALVPLVGVLPVHRLAS